MDGAGYPSGMATPPLVAGGYDSPADVVGSVEGDHNIMRQRSTSPSGWHFKLSSQAANRVRSGEGSGATTPARSYGAPATAMPRSASGGRYQQAAARASYESALLSAVRRQIEAFEDKVGGQINRIQTHSDRLQQAAFTRLEEKMRDTEGLQPKVDRRIAELTGNFKGLSDEMQVQIRRVDLMDERLWEWRHQMEEEFRHKFSEFEQSVHKISSNNKVLATSMEDHHKRHSQRQQRLEQEIADRLTHHESAHAHISGIQDRLDALEEHGYKGIAMASAAHDHMESSARSPPHVDDHGDFTAMFAILEQRVADMSDRADRVFQDAHDVHARMNSQEERVKTLRTRVESLQEHFRQLLEKVERSDWTGRMDTMTQSLHDVKKDRLSHEEKVEVLARRLDHQEQAHDDLRKAHHEASRVSSREVHFSYGAHFEGSEDPDARSMPSPGRGLAEGRGADSPGGHPHPMGYSSAGPGGSRGELSAMVEELVARVDDADMSIRALQEAHESDRADHDLAPRMGALVAQLKEIGPKVIEQDRRLGELSERIEETNRTIIDLHSEHKDHRSSIDELRARDPFEGVDMVRHEHLTDVAAALHGRLEQVLEQGVPSPRGGRGGVTREELDDHHSTTRARLESLSQRVEAAHARAGLAVTREELDDHHSTVRGRLDSFGERLEAAQARAGLAVTREELDHRCSSLTSDFGKLHQQVSELSGRSVSAVPQEEMEALRREFAGLSGEVGGLRGDFEGFRAEPVSVANGVGRDELDSLHSGIRSELDRLREQAACGNVRADSALQREEWEAHHQGLRAELEKVRTHASEARSRAEGALTRQDLEDHQRGLREEFEALRAQASGAHARTEELQERLRTLRSELDNPTGSIQAGQGSSSEAVEELREELRNVMQLVREELNLLSQQGTQSERTAEDLAQAKQSLRDLQHQVTGLLSSGPSPDQLATVTQQDIASATEPLRQELMQLAAATSKLAAGDVQHAKPDLAALREELSENHRSEVEALRRRLDDHMRPDAAVVELARQVLEDEEEEQLAEQKVLARLDEVCMRLAHASQAAAGASGLYVPSDLASQFANLSDRVEHSERRCGDLQTQIQTKFGDMMRTVERIRQIEEDRQGDEEF